MNEEALYHLRSYLFATCYLLLLLRRSSGKRVVVPTHSGKDLKQGTLLGMLKDIGIDKEEFFELLEK